MTSVPSSSGWYVEPLERAWSKRSHSVNPTSDSCPKARDSKQATAGDRSALSALRSAKECFSNSTLVGRQVYADYRSRALGA
jgi:hypothetical protein